MRTQKSPKRCHWQMLAVTVAACAAPAVHAQSTTAKPIAPPDETVMLSPFEVVTDVDKGYQATSTLSGARLATSLKDTPAVIGVLTKEFLQDIAGQNITDFGNWAVNTIVWGSDQNINTNFVDRDLVQARMRATNPAFTNYRNYFGTQAPMDYFNTERLEIPRGPNSLLYGDGPLGGLTTTNTKRATFGTNFAVPALIFDSLGSKRATLDVNRTLGKNVAARVNLLSQRNEGWRDGEFYNRETGHGAISYRPWKNTLFRGEAEWGHTEKDGDWRTYTDQASLWDGRTNVNSANFLAAGTGTGRTTGAADYYLLDQSNPTAGLVNWIRRGQTTGSSRSILPREFDPATYRPGLANFARMPNRKFSLSPHAAQSKLDYRILSVFAEQTVGKLAMEVGYNYEIAKNDWFRDRAAQYFIDLNPTRPTPSGVDEVNPNYLKAFDDYQMQKQYTWNWAHSARATAAYPFDFGFMTQKALVMGLWSDQENRDNFYRLARDNGPVEKNLQQASNLIYTRRYWDGGSGTPLALPSLGDAGNGIHTVWNNNLLQGSKTQMETLQVATVGSYFKGALSSIVGYRRDSRTNDVRRNFGTSNDWRTKGILSTDYAPLLKGQTTPSLLDPTGEASGIWSSQRMDLINAALPYDAKKNPRFSELYPLKSTVGTFSTGLVWFPVKFMGAFVNYSTGFTAPGFLAAKMDFVPIDPLKKTGVDYGVKLELLDGRISGTVSTYRSYETGYGTSVGTGQNAPQNIWAAAESGYLDSATAARLAGDTALATSYDVKAADARTKRLANSPNYTDTQTTSASGYEIDLTARPTKAWSIMFNYAKPKATTKSRLNDTKAFWAANRDSLAAYLKDTTGLAAFRLTAINDQLVNGDALIANAVDGYTLDQVPEFTANFFTSYRFAEGKLKGFRFGGGVQARGKWKLATSKQVYGVNPQTKRTEFYAPVLFDTYYSPGAETYTLMAGYEFTAAMHKWNLQLNVANVLDEDKITFTSYANYTYVENGVTKGAQVPQGFRYLDPRKATISLTTRF